MEGAKESGSLAPVLSQQSHLNGLDLRLSDVVAKALGVSLKAYGQVALLLGGNDRGYLDTDPSQSTLSRPCAAPARSRMAGVIVCAPL